MQIRKALTSIEDLQSDIQGTKDAQEDEQKRHGVNRKHMEEALKDLQELQKSKRKNADVDTKASKGRKIRYNVHPKLQNFMFPSNTSKRRDTMDEQLLKSLFQ